MSLRVVAAAAFGIGAWSGGYAAALLLGLPRLPVATAVAVAGVVLAFRAASREPQAASRAVPAWLWAAFGAACVLDVAVFIEHTLRFPDGGYDAWMIWNTRARFLSRAADFRTAFSPHLSFWLHTDYPWLLPGIVARLGHPAIVAAVFGVLCLAALVFAVARVRGAYWGFLAGLVLATTPCFPIFASNQQSDVPLALFFLLACALLEEQPLLAGFAAGLGAWTKNEGLLYLLCLAIALRKPRETGRFLLGAAPLLALLALFKLTLPVHSDLISAPAQIVGRALDLRRWGELVLLVLRRIVFFQDFALWVVAEVLLLLVVRPRTVLGTALFLACAAYAPIYVLQPHPLDWIFRTSVDRIFIQLWPAAILATVTALVPAPATART
jgi:hypothetical protein